MPDGKRKMGKMGKAKMQVRMIEKPGDMICCASPFEPPQPLPFQITSLKRTVLLSLHMQDLLTILDMVNEAQTEAICKAMHAEHRNILLSVMPKTKPGSEQSTRESRMDAEPDTSMAEGGQDMPKASFDDKDLSEPRLHALEGEIDRVIKAMGELHKEARQIPRLVHALSQMHGKPLQPMGPAATKALEGMKPVAKLEPKSPGGSDSEMNKLLDDTATS